jgi:hypothetical protein
MAHFISATGLSADIFYGFYRDSAEKKQLKIKMQDFFYIMTLLAPSNENILVDQIHR